MRVVKNSIAGGEKTGVNFWMY